MTSNPTNFVAACKDFFGYKPGLGLQAFAHELKALTPTDREEIRAGLAQQGYNIPDEGMPKAA